MKKIYFLALMSASAAAFAQSGKVGINATSPAATLDIQPSTANATGTSNEGILIPRLTSARVAAMASPTEGTMVYVTDAPASSKFSDTTKGFYYWDAAAAKWTKMGSGAAGVSSNIYTADGTLSSARTVNQNNQNLTFTTGSGQMIVNGTYKGTGAVYQNVRIQALPMSSSDWTVSDYAIILNGGGAATIGLPDPATNQGRVIAFSLQSTASSAANIVSNPPYNNSTIETGKGFTVISANDSGTWRWFVIGGY